MPSTSSPVVNPRKRAAHLAHLDRLADRLDSRFEVAGIRFGWDSILGLIPGVGDVATAAPGVYIISQAARLGVRRRILARMTLNTGTDFLIGGIPLIGDLFDVAFKANRRNVALVKRELERDGTLPAAVDPVGSQHI